MAIASAYPELAGAHDCKFCGGDFLYFARGAVVCDRCQAEGPFSGYQFDNLPEGTTPEEARIEAVRRWNLTPEDDWSDED